MALTTLGNKVTEFQGFETIPVSHGLVVEYLSDEITSLCPVTGQPDWYTVHVVCRCRDKGLESKTLKLYLQSFRNRGLFCESLCETIHADIQGVLNPLSLSVALTQKSRGGIVLRVEKNTGEDDE